MKRQLARLLRRTADRFDPVRESKAPSEFVIELMRGIQQGMQQGIANARAEARKASGAP